MNFLVALVLGLVVLLLLMLAPRAMTAWKNYYISTIPKARSRSQPIYLIASPSHFKAAVSAASCPEEIRLLSTKSKNVPCCVYVHSDLIFAPHWDLAYRACEPLKGLASHGVTARLRVLTTPFTFAAPLSDDETPDPGILAGPSDLVQAAVQIIGRSRTPLSAWRLALWLKLSKLHLSAAPYEIAYLAGHGEYLAPTEEEHNLAWQESKAAPCPRAALPALPHLLSLA